MCRLSLAQLNLHMCEDGDVRLLCRDESMPRDREEAERTFGDGDFDDDEESASH